MRGLQLYLGEQNEFVLFFSNDRAASVYHKYTPYLVKFIIDLMVESYNVLSVALQDVLTRWDSEGDSLIECISLAKRIILVKANDKQK